MYLLSPPPDIGRDKHVNSEQYRKLLNEKRMDLEEATFDLTTEENERFIRVRSICSFF